LSYLKSYLDDKIKNGEKILSIYLTAGFPTVDATLPLLETITSAGADIIEIGVPFSDPLADGPTIQQASQVALRNNISLPKIFEIISDLKIKHDIPVLLMGYCNPFLQFGWERLARSAEDSQISGFIIPDLPPEESGAVKPIFQQKEIDLIYLAAPNTPPERLRQIEQLSNSFIYAVSLTGVTGTRDKLPDQTKDFLIRLRQISKKNILVGFGVSNSATAQNLVHYCDGVIIGSAIIKLIQNSPEPADAKKRIFDFIKKVKGSLKNNIKLTHLPDWTMTR
jgi:tryptophan synthase alpha chain